MFHSKPTSNGKTGQGFIPKQKRTLKLKHFVDSRSYGFCVTVSQCFLHHCVFCVAVSHVSPCHSLCDSHLCHCVTCVTVPQVSLCHRCHCIIMSPVSLYQCITCIICHWYQYVIVSVSHCATDTYRVVRLWQEV